VYNNILCLSLLQDFVSSENAFQYMMQFPLLKMQHNRVIVGKLLSTIQMTEVSKLFLQKNTSMVRSSFRSGYTSKSRHTFGPNFCSFYSKFSLNRHLYKSDYNSIKNGNVRCGKEQGGRFSGLDKIECIFIFHNAGLQLNLFLWYIFSRSARCVFCRRC